MRVPPSRSNIRSINKTMKLTPADHGLAPPLTPLTVQTHDNGGRAFQVTLEREEVIVSRLEYREATETYGTVGTPFVYRPERVFIGRSPKNACTEFSGGHGKRFYGNSVLLDMGNGRYVHVGTNIMQFHAENMIEWFMSPVGNSDVPYPYAVDSRGSVYLLIEGVVLVDGANVTDDDPYDSYYARSLITPDIGRVPPRKPAVAFDGIQGWYMEGKPYTLRYKPNAAKDWNRLTQSTTESGKPMYTPMYIEVGGVKKEMDVAAYVDLMERFGAASGFRPFESAVLAPPS